MKRFSSSEFTYRDARRTFHASSRDISTLFQSLNSSADGLLETEVKARQKHYGLNIIFEGIGTSTEQLLLKIIRNPFNYLVLFAAIVSLFSGEKVIALALTTLVVMNGIVNFVQEFRYHRQVGALVNQVQAKANVLRRNSNLEGFQTLPSRYLVPGDIIKISAGEMVPADVRLFSTYHLSINQSAITGEIKPSEKTERAQTKEHQKIFELENICLMGTHVMSGSGTGIVLSTGPKTYFGSVELHLKNIESESSLTVGATQLNRLLLTYLIVTIPVLLLLSSHSHGLSLESFIFALALGAGLTPELLPIMVTLNLGKGASAMANKNVLIKNLDKIPTLGAMNILCTDKTGTLTEDAMVLAGSYNLDDLPDVEPIKSAYLNSFFQSGINNYVDVIVLQQKNLHEESSFSSMKLLQELPFDFTRRRSTILLDQNKKINLVICKGAPEDVLPLCNKIILNQVEVPLTESNRAHFLEKLIKFSDLEQRIILVATKEVKKKPETGIESNPPQSLERELTLTGYLIFIDPPIKESAKYAIHLLRQSKIFIKILTGDNQYIATKIARKVNIHADTSLSGVEVASLSDSALSHCVEDTNIFYKLTPYDKMRVVLAIRRNGHSVGFLGEGINDTQALRAADIGISVSNAVAIAKNSADVILLEKDLRVLNEGVLEGRVVFNNLAKYIRMSCSSNVGHIFTVLIASAFLPFLPITAIQALIQKVLTNFSQLGIPFDRVDHEDLRTQKSWDMREIHKTMLFMGPIGSLRAIATFCLMWFVFKGNSSENQSIFQTGLFVEGVVSQSFIMHLNRTRKIPFIESRASRILTMTTLTSMMTGIALPLTTWGKAIGLIPLPISYYPYLGLILIVHAIIATKIKSMMIRKFGSF